MSCKFIIYELCASSYNFFLISPGFKPTTSGTGIPHSTNTAAHETFTKKLETLNKFGKFAKPNRKGKIPVYILVPVPNYFRGQKSVQEKYLYMVVKIPVYGGKKKIGSID